MPELPEVETVKRGLAPVLENAQIKRFALHSPSLRQPLDKSWEQVFTGQTITRLSRRGKYLCLHTQTGEGLVIHLGMSGSFRVCGDNTPCIKHDHYSFYLTSGQAVHYNDPRRFGILRLFSKEQGWQADPAFRKMGPEPLEEGFDASYLKRVLEEKVTPIKTSLLDQSVVAGLGNIYVCEALHMAAIHPKRKSGAISLKRLERLVASIKEVLARAIEAGGSSLRDHKLTDGSLGYFQHQFLVYGREGEPCPTCHVLPDGANSKAQSLIKRAVQSGRSSFYCPRCQS